MESGSCQHKEVVCINEHELIRKYRCVTCAELMMCACDERRGTKHLPHQLREGCVLETQERVPVTLHFQPGICRECRGLKPTPSPKSSIPGRTSKIKRFYWREIMFREFDAFDALGISDHLFLPNSDPQAAHVRDQVLSEIKRLHETQPKYDFTTESEADFITRNGIKIVSLRAETKPGGEVVLQDGILGRPEDYAANWLRDQGYEILHCESRPFHVLFAVLLWPLIQDSDDELIQMTTFGERNSFEEFGQSTQSIITLLPKDFGTSGYAVRRKNILIEYFENHLPKSTDELLRFFDALIPGAFELRQYLWAHKETDAQLARELLSAIPPDVIRRCLTFLLQDYWDHYIGWPDLFAWREQDQLFAEVKLSNDKLSDAQRTWIEGNASLLHFQFHIIKIHKSNKTDTRISS